MPRSGNLSVLFVTTWAFTACFAVWTMFGVTGIPIREQLNLDSTEVGLLTATPVLTGALFRLPLGIWTDRFGGRIIMLLLLVGCAVAKRRTWRCRISGSATNSRRANNSQRQTMACIHQKAAMEKRSQRSSRHVM